MVGGGGELGYDVGSRQVTILRSPVLERGGGKAEEEYSVLFGSPFSPYVGLSEKVSSGL